MMSSHLPPRLESLVHQGRIVPVIGGAGLVRLAAEYIDLLQSLEGIDCKAVISLAKIPLGRETIAARGWHVKQRTNSHYDLDSKIWIELGAGLEDDAAQPFDSDYWSQLELNEPYLWDCALAFAARDTLLILNCDPEDAVAQSVIGSLRSKAHFRSGGWIVWYRPLEPETEWTWNALGFELVILGVPALIGQLQRASCTRALLRLNENYVESDTGQPPYKLLHYYDVDDARFFFGREVEVERLVGMIGAHPLVVVTGASGAGKTSLLNAGVLSWFSRHPPYEGFYVRFRDDPWRAFQKAISGEDPGETKERDIAAIFRSLVESVQKREILPIVIFDQFEELFVRFSRIVQDQFWELIRWCLMSTEIPIRVVVVIREDYLGQLASMRNQYPAILQNSFYVPPLSGPKAHAAIVRPAARVGVRFDNDLAWQIIRELEQRSTVSAPELQIVCDALFARREDREIVAADYERLGGAAQILATFMKSELARRGAAFQAVATKVLKALVTSEETKENLPLARIAQRAKMPIEDTMQVLATLRDDCRFVRSLAGDDVGFELSHDYLAREIRTWMSDDEKEERLAHELLEREMRAWRHFGSIRLGPDRLAYFRKRLHNELLDDATLLYLLLSSVRHLEPSARWVEGVRALDAATQRQIANRLFESIEDTDLASRREAAEVTALLDPFCVIESINAPILARRMAAIEIAGGLKLVAAADALMERLDDETETEACQALACGALGELLSGRDDIVSRLSGLATGATSPRIANAAVAALGHLANRAEIRTLICDALCSDQPERRDAAVAAAARGSTAALFEHLVTSRQYELVTAGTKAALWDLILRLPEPTGGPMIVKIVSLLPRKDLLRYDKQKWVGHWLYHRLIHEFCSRFPEECTFEKDKEAAIRSALSQFEYSVAGVQKIASKNFIDELVEHIWHMPPSAIILGNLLRELISSSDPILRVTALRLAYRHGRPQVLDGLERYLPASRVRTFLKAKEPTERYWACLVTGAMRYRDNAELLRELSVDAGVAKSFDAKIGMQVKDAAAHVLNALSPSSAVWRKDWQRSFNPDRKA